jgi:acyl-CoA thioester hydrolase
MMPSALVSSPQAKPFEWPVRVYWEDTDAGGIVFYANYLKFFERARTEWLRALGLNQRALLQSHGGLFVVADTQVRYLQPARLDDELIVTAVLQKKGNSSLTIAQQALLKSELTIEQTRGQLHSSLGSLVCEGSIRIGWVNAHTLKPARIPPMLMETLK